MKIKGIMKKNPKKSDFNRLFWPDFPKMLTIFQNYRISEPLIVEICMTTHIETLILFQGAFCAHFLGLIF